MIERLREATRELHEEIEKENEASKIIDHSITLEEYKFLLLQNYIAYKVTENAISGYLSDYPATKHEQLKKDLKNLNIDYSIAAKFDREFSCDSKAEALGAAYVVEGSAMGGLVIGRELQKCPQLSHLGEQHFFNGKRDDVKNWNLFKKKLQNYHFSKEEENIAVEKARETFRFFGKIFSEAGKTAI
ncbi:biliverdin-producing heme oxygenase [Salinimicrobium sp. GXAS 041]|uniref:biliverdin-producing heme oxygenase n=1 Tax=Salinimicrobium sp. GXAS 041 TaxID=3400806 RepID=UPI003C7268D9